MLFFKQSLKRGKSINNKFIFGESKLSECSCEYMFPTYSILPILYRNLILNFFFEKTSRVCDIKKTILVQLTNIAFLRIITLYVNLNNPESFSFKEHSSTIFYLFFCEHKLSFQTYF